MKQSKAKTMKTVSSIIYRGSSLIDGKPIVCIAIKGSKNVKTGGVLQAYILNDNGMSPLENSKSGNDVSICGSCIHRGKATDKPSKKQAEGRSCYVNLGQGPTIVYKALQRGVYPMATPEQIKALGAGYTVRLGTYGDPAAAPREVWDMLIQDAEGHTGYTHNLKHQPSMHELCNGSTGKGKSIAIVAHGASRNHIKG